MTMLRTFSLFLVFLLAETTAAIAQELRFEFLFYSTEAYGFDQGQMIYYPMHFDAKGQRQGALVAYTDDGKDSLIRFKGRYENGRLVDSALYFFPDGSLQRKVFLSREGTSAVLPWKDLRTLALYGAPDGKAITFFPRSWNVQTIE